MHLQVKESNYASEAPKIHLKAIWQPKRLIREIHRKWHGKKECLRCRMDSVLAQYPTTPSHPGDWVRTRGFHTDGKRESFQGLCGRDRPFKDHGTSGQPAQRS